MYDYKYMYVKLLVHVHINFILLIEYVQQQTFIILSKEGGDIGMEIILVPKVSSLVFFGYTSWLLLVSNHKFPNFTTNNFSLKPE